MGSKCLIYTYAFFLAVILVAQIGAGIAAYMLKGDLDAEVVKNMNKGMENYEKPNFDGVTTTWDIVQKELQCCGVENSTDWANTRPDMFTAKQTPDSCCVGGQVLLIALYCVWLILTIVCRIRDVERLMRRSSR